MKWTAVPGAGCAGLDFAHQCFVLCLWVGVRVLGAQANPHLTPHCAPPLLWALEGSCRLAPFSSLSRKARSSRPFPGRHLSPEPALRLHRHPCVSVHTRSVPVKNRRSISGGLTCETGAFRTCFQSTHKTHPNVLLKTELQMSVEMPALYHCNGDHHYGLCSFPGTGT